MLPSVCSPFCLRPTWEHSSSNLSFQSVYFKTSWTNVATCYLLSHLTKFCYIFQRLSFWRCYAHSNMLYNITLLFYYFVEVQQKFFITGYNWFLQLISHWISCHECRCCSSLRGNFGNFSLKDTTCDWKRLKHGFAMFVHQKSLVTFGTVTPVWILNIPPMTFIWHN